MTTASARIVQRITDAGLIAIIRTDRSEGLIETFRALRDAGVDVAEITMTTPGAIDAIAAAVAEFSDEVLIGVGSVLDADTARLAIEAGAQFVVAPTFKTGLLSAVHAMGKPMVPGALTPTEILGAWEAGAGLVKVFPANHFGPRYFKDLLAPMPHLKLVPTGGVDQHTIVDWFAAGATCVGAGSALVRKDLVERRDWAGLRAVAQQFVDAVNEARSTS